MNPSDLLTLVQHWLSSLGSTVTLPGAQQTIPGTVKPTAGVDTSSSPPAQQTLGAAASFSQNFIVLGLVAIGMVIAADYAPRVVNGVLILILVGILLRNAGPITSALGGQPSN